MDLTTMRKNEDSRIQLIDVRVGPSDLRNEQIPGSIHIPQTEILDRMDKIQSDAQIVLYCWDTWCSLATKAAIPLLERGFDAKELYGGLAAWNTLDLPTERVDPENPPREPDFGDGCGC